MMRTKLDIYEYMDYRAYLRDRLSELKAADKKYSLRFLARKLGLSSNSHIKMVIDGEHNMSLDLGRRLAGFLKLNKKETAFLLALISYCQAKTQAEKNEALEQLRMASRFVKLHQVKLDQFDYYSDPLLVTLREMVALSDFREDYDWILKRLPQKASRYEVEEALAKLQRLRLLSRDGAGRLFATDPHITSGAGLGRMALKQYYTNSFERARQALDLPPEERHVTGMTMAVSERAYGRILEHFEKFMDKVREEVDLDTNPDRVYQIVMAYFPLTEKEEKKNA